MVASSHIIHFSFLLAIIYGCLDDVTQKTKKQEGDIMADGEVVFEATISDKKLHQELNKVKSNIESLQKEFNRLGAQKTPMEDQLRNIGAELDAAKQVLADMRTAPKGTYEKIDVSEQAERVRMLQSEFNKTANSIDKLNEKLNKTGDKISNAKTQAVELTQQIEGRAKGAGLRNATEATADSMKVFGQRLKSVVRSALVFTVITQALSKVRDWVKNVVMVNSDARESIAQLKGALLTLAQPLVSVIVPAFTLLVKVITAVVSQITRLVALVSGKSVKATADSAKALNKQTNALKGTGNAAKKAAGQLAAFDEINQISTDTANDMGGGASADAITPDFSYMDDISDRLKKIADAVMLIAAGLALWKISSSLPGVLGTILKKLGGILIAVGGLIILWESLSDAWNNGVNWKNLLGSLAGTAALAGGLALAFGKVGAGIGLVIAGAAMIITAFKDICDNGANLQNTLLLIAGIVATGLGFFFLTGSVIPLVIAGIATVVTAVLALTGNLTEFARNLKDNILGGIIQFIKGVFTGDMKSAFEGLKKVFKGLINADIILVESFINTVIRALNWLIKQINKISFDVPDWVPGIGGKTLGVNIPAISEKKLPRLATGTVIPPNKEFLAVLGDQKSGTNIEAPLATIEQAVANVLAQQSRNQNITIEFSGNLAALARVLNPHIKSENTRVGGNLVVQK
jgi:predicted  nucleic acid-binding Zn-ribbon protein